MQHKKLILGFALAAALLSLQVAKAVLSNPSSSTSASVTSSTIATAGGALAANNLSDLTNTSTARTNLGITNEICMEPAFNIENPTASEDLPIWRARATSTITKAYSVHKAGSDTATFNVVFGGTRASSSATSRHLFSADQVSTSTAGNSYTSGFSSTTVDNGMWVRVITSAASSSDWTFTLCYTAP